MNSDTGVFIGFVLPSLFAGMVVVALIIGRIDMWWRKRSEAQEDRVVFEANQLAIGRLVELYRLMVDPLPYIAEKIDARIRQLMTWIDQEAPLMRPGELHLLHPVQNDLIVLLSHATTKMRGETPVEFRSRMMAYLDGSQEKVVAQPAPEALPEPEPEVAPEPAADEYMESVAKPPEYRRPSKDDEDTRVAVGNLGVKVDSSLVDMWEKSENHK